MTNEERTKYRNMGIIDYFIDEHPEMIYKNKSGNYQIKKQYSNGYNIVLYEIEGQEPHAYFFNGTEPMLKDMRWKDNMGLLEYLFDITTSEAQNLLSEWYSHKALSLFDDIDTINNETLPTIDDTPIF